MVCLKKYFFFILLTTQCIPKADKSDIVYSEKISYCFTSDEYDISFFTAANRGYFDKIGFNFLV